MKLTLSEAAVRSIVEQADYYQEKADLPLALRWESAVDQATQSLQQFPERGTPCRFRSPQLAGLRWIFIPGFPRHMLFYRIHVEEDSILIVKVAHGARDLESLLSEKI